MIEWLGDNHWAVWLGLAIVLGTIETMTLDLVFLMLAGGAAAGAVAAALGASPLLALLVAVVGTAALLGVVRPVALRHIRQPSISRTGVDALVGRRAVVIEQVDRHDGRIKLGGETWSARSYDEESVIAPGAAVDVIEIKGATALVYPAEG